MQQEEAPQNLFTHFYMTASIVYVANTILHICHALFLKELSIIRGLVLWASDQCFLNVLLPMQSYHYVDQQPQHTILHFRHIGFYL